MNETPISQAIRLAISREKLATLFRNNVGAYKAPSGQLVRYGLQKGSGDLIGWKTKQITQDMVGKNIAIFVSLEVKGPGGTSSPEQRHWREVVRLAGGVAEIVYSEAEALEVLK